MDNLERLRAAFRTGLGLTDTHDVDDLEYRAIPEWDSIAQMALVTEIEAAFDILIETDEVIDMSSFAKAKQIVTGHGVDLAETAHAADVADITS